MAITEFRVLKAPCQKCGAYHNETITAVERRAVSNGWNLSDFREAVKLGPDGIRALLRRRDEVDPPRDIAVAIRAARVETAEDRANRLTGLLRVAAPTHSLALVAIPPTPKSRSLTGLAEPTVVPLGISGVPPAPDLIAAIRAARGGVR